MFLTFHLLVYLIALVNCSNFNVNHRFLDFVIYTLPIHCLRLSILSMRYEFNYSEHVNQNLRVIKLFKVSCQQYSIESSKKARGLFQLLIRQKNDFTDN